MNLNDLTTTLASSPTLSAIGIAAMILFFGFRLLTNIKSDSPFSPYAIQILALIVVLPVVLTLALTAKFPTEALTGLLGTIVGFFFGGAHQAQHGLHNTLPRSGTAPANKVSHGPSHEKQDEDMGGEGGR